MSRAIADTSVFIAREADRPLGELPDVAGRPASSAGTARLSAQPTDS